MREQHWQPQVAIIRKKSEPDALPSGGKAKAKPPPLWVMKFQRLWLSCCLRPYYPRWGSQLLGRSCSPMASGNRKRRQKQGGGPRSHYSSPCALTCPPHLLLKHPSGHLGTGRGLDFDFLTLTSRSLLLQNNKIHSFERGLREKKRTESHSYSVAQAGLQLTKVENWKASCLSVSRAEVADKPPSHTTF